MQLLRESYGTYKSNFTNIVAIILPLTILSLVGGIMGVFAKQHEEDSSYYMDLILRLRDSLGLGGLM